MDCLVWRSIKIETVEAQRWCGSEPKLPSASSFHSHTFRFSHHSFGRLPNEVLWFFGGDDCFFRCQFKEKLSAIEQSALSTAKYSFLKIITRYLFFRVQISLRSRSYSQLSAASRLERRSVWDSCKCLAYLARSQSTTSP